MRKMSCLFVIFLETGFDRRIERTAEFRLVRTATEELVIKKRIAEGHVCYRTRKMSCLIIIIFQTVRQIEKS